MQHNHAAQHYQRSTMPPPPKRVSQTFPRGTAVSPPPPVLSSERAELTLRLPDESNQDHAWIPQVRISQESAMPSFWFTTRKARWWWQHSQDTTPHYNCTPDEQPTALPARPPAPPSPKSHRRANRGPRFFPDADSGVCPYWAYVVKQNMDVICFVRLSTQMRTAQVRERRRQGRVRLQ